MMREAEDRVAPARRRDRRYRLFVLALAIVQLLALVFALAGPAIGRPAPVAAGRSFACRPIAVWDGDGPIWCREGARVRLAGIATRELDGTCRPGHPCPAASGIAARDSLVRILGGARGRRPEGHVIVAGPALTCRSLGADRYARTLAHCAAPAIGDLGRAQIRAGVALRW